MDKKISKFSMDKRRRTKDEPRFDSEVKMYGTFHNGHFICDVDAEFGDIYYFGSKDRSEYYLCIYKYDVKGKGDNTFSLRTKTNEVELETKLDVEGMSKKQEKELYTVVVEMYDGTIIEAISDNKNYNIGDILLVSNKEEVTLFNSYQKSFNRSRFERYSEINIEEVKLVSYDHANTPKVSRYNNVVRGLLNKHNEVSKSGLFYEAIELQTKFSQAIGVNGNYGSLPVNIVLREKNRSIHYLENLVKEIKGEDKDLRDANNYLNERRIRKLFK